MTLELTKEQIYDIKTFLAFVLRHKPHFYRVKLDGSGFADMDSIIKAISKNKKINISKEQLIEISKRYSGGIFVVQDDKIRARDGHTVILNMSIPDGYVEIADVPKILYMHMDKADVGKILSNNGVSLSGTNLCLVKESPAPSETKTIVSINTQKTKADSIKFYYNSGTGTYFARNIAARYISVHV